jgi:hypothetical protein
MNEMIANVLVASTMLMGMNTVYNADGDPLCSTCTGKLRKNQARRKKASAVATVLLIASFLPGSAWAQAPGEKVAASPLLGWLGVATMVAGGSLMVPWSEGENYKINGQTYCYSQGRNYLNFERGACGVTEPTPTMIKTGAVIAAAGGVMALLGFRRVEFIPGIPGESVGMGVAIKWGGKR